MASDLNITLFTVFNSFIMNIYFKGPSETDTFAITFDDGPHYYNTPKLLELLNDFNSRATFFMTGSNASKNKALVREVSQQGHLIGNHSLNHLKKFFLSPQELMCEIKTAKDILEDIISKPITLYRPPYGFISPFLFSICKETDLKIVLWSLQTHDYRRENYPVILKRTMKKIKAGSIILFHEGHFNNASLDYSNTIDAVRFILNKSMSMKIKPATVNRVLEFKD